MTHPEIDLGKQFTQFHWRGKFIEDIWEWARERHYAMCQVEFKQHVTIGDGCIYIHKWIEDVPDIFLGCLLAGSRTSFEILSRKIYNDGDWCDTED